MISESGKSLRSDPFGLELRQLIHTCKARNRTIPCSREGSSYHDAGNPLDGLAGCTVNRIATHYSQVMDARHGIATEQFLNRVRESVRRVSVRANHANA